MTRWLALLLALIVGSCAAQQTSAPKHEPLPQFVLPSAVPGWWEFCVEGPGANWEVPGEPVMPGPTVCRGTVNQLRHEFSHLRRAQ